MPSLQVTRANLALLFSIAFGVGVLSAFGFFYAQWKSKCHALHLRWRQEGGVGPTDFSKGDGPGSCSSKMEQLQRQLRDSEQSLFQLQGSIQRYHQAQVWRDYGSEEPYRVVFTLELPERGSEEDDREPYYSYQDLTIHLRNLEDMPHTVATFLALADLGLYVGTTLGATSLALLGGGESSDPTPIMVGGSVQQLPSGQVRQHLVRQYHEFGYTGTHQAPLWFPEASNQLPCGLHSVYVVHPGPQFAILLSDPPRSHHRDGLVSCPGRVVGAANLLERLKGEPATIVETRVLSSRRWLQADDGEPSQRDEL